MIGWSLDPEEREALLARFAPAYPDVVADHVTLRAGKAEGVSLPPPERGEIVGRADDGAGVEAYVVSIGGTTDRPGGGTYDITWSLDRGAAREAVESNDVIARRGWTRLEETRPVTLQPLRRQS
ncbi:MAG TPA: hypothetical protein VF559_10155 [Caulobacteraceae bacterium]|jgi:hypothetical protein